MTTDPVVTARGLVVGHGGRAVLPPIDLTITRGRVLLVLGPNGAGKTTLVRTLLGLLAPVAGTVRWAPGLRRAYVPQAAALDATVPVRARDVVGWGTLRGWDFARPWRRAPAGAIDDAMATLEVGGLGDRPVRELSGGQLQRVLFARMLAGAAEVAVLDEPTAAIDAAGERSVYLTLGALARERGLAVVVVTHAIGAALTACDDVLLLDPGEPGPAVVHGPVAEVAEGEAFRRLFGVCNVPDHRAGHAHGPGTYHGD